MEYKEYDLIDIIQFFWKLWVDYIWNPMVYLLRFCLQRWYAFLLAVAVGAALAFVLSGKQPATYSSNMVVYYTAESSTDLIGIVGEINGMSAEERMQQLQLTAEEAQAWVSLTPRYVLNVNGAEVVDTENKWMDSKTELVSRQLCIQVCARTQTANVAIQKALLDYLNADKGLQMQYQLRKMSTQKSIEALKQQCAMIEALPNEERGTLLNSYLSSAAEVIRHEQNLARETDAVLLKSTSMAVNQPAKWYNGIVRYAVLVAGVLLVCMLVFNFRKEIYYFIYPDKK